MKKFASEFKEFAMKGNVIDLAVGIIIGGAFGKIISSFVSDIIMPPIGVLLGGTDFTSLSLTIKEAIVKKGDVVSEAVTLNYGNFLQTSVDFLIVAFAIFLMIKAVNSAKRKQKDEKVEEEKAKPSREEELLVEIRDLLKQK